MNIVKIIFTISIVMCVMTFSSFADDRIVEVTAYGDASIVDNEISSAKLLAISRAKWAALEEAAGITVKSEVLINNANLLDNNIISESSGVIESYIILEEGIKNDTLYQVKIRASISPEKAEKAKEEMSQNTSVAVYILLHLPSGEIISDNSLSGSISEGLSSAGFNVVNITPSTINPGEKELVALSSDNLSNYVLYGNIKTVSLGNNTGYGQSPFETVSAELSYKLLEDKGVDAKILLSGYNVVKGYGTTPNHAGISAAGKMAKNLQNEIVGKVSSTILGLDMKTVKVVLKDNRYVDDLLEFKNAVNRVAWVQKVETDGLETLLVDYPEKTMYLSAYIDAMKEYSVVKFDEYSITVKAR